MSEIGSDPTPSLEAVIEVYEMVRKRPHMYLGRYEGRDVPEVEFYIQGVLHACSALGVPYPLWRTEERRKLVSARGWKSLRLSVAQEMRKRGYSEDDIVEELLTIEIELLRQQLPRIHRVN